MHVMYWYYCYETLMPCITRPTLLTPAAAAAAFTQVAASGTAATLREGRLLQLIADNSLLYTDVVTRIGLLDTSQTAWAQDKYVGVHAEGMGVTLCHLCCLGLLLYSAPRGWVSLCVTLCHLCCLGLLLYSAPRGCEGINVERMTYDDSSNVAAVMLGVAHRSTAAAVVLVTAAAAAAAESLFTLHAMSVKTP
jgi:hypothetical protein